MPDLGPLVGKIGELVAPLLGQALGAVLRTTAGMAALGVVVAAGSFYLAAAGSTPRGLLAGVLALALCAVVGGLLAGRRAVARVLGEALRRAQVGTAVLRLVFDRAFGLTEVGAAVERLPLGEAERRFTEVVCGTVGGPTAGAGLRGKVRARLVDQLLRGIRLITLARFRAADASGGGIDVVKIRDELAGRIDALLIARVEAAARRATIVLIAVAVGLSVAGALAIRLA